MSDFENIPEELREREQWLMWDAAADTPRRPHWCGNFAISWTNPDDWHTFEEAAEAAAERESWGIGYVFANTMESHPRGLYGGLDLDGCADPDAGPKEWLPSLQPFFERGAYMEKSPSETGVHIPIAGFEPPEWWSNVFFSDDEHEGVEAYGHKFFTFTGDRLYSSEFENEAVVDHGEWVDDWLAEAYEEITGEDPRATPEVEAPTESDYQGGDWMDVDVAGEALEHIDPDVDYPIWRNIGFGLADEFPAGTAEQLFTHWSSGGMKWDDEAERQAERIIQDASPAGANEPDISTVVYHAKEGGWEPPTGAPEPTSDGSEVVETPASGGESGDGNESESEEDSERELPTPVGHGISVRDGGYGRVIHREDGDEWDEYTNFQLETNSYATDPDDPREKRIDLAVHPRHGEPYSVVVPPTVFNEKREFKGEVVTGLSTTFSGGEDVLNKLREFVGTQEAPFRIGTYQMGLHDGEWVTPNGVLKADGWENDPEHVHVPRKITPERSWTLEPEDGHEYDSDEVAAIVETLPETRERERFLPALGWFYATPMKPLIHEWSGQFNLLSVLGETGSGKTATLSALWEAFGMDSDPMTADDTKYVILSTLASTNAIPMWFDEYKPSDMRSYEVDRFWNEVRKTTRGGRSSRGNPDGSTDEYHLTAPVVVSGEERVHGSAEERRGIFTTFRKGATDAGTETSRAFAKLTGGSAKVGDDGEQEIEYYEGLDLSQHALAYYRFVLAADNDQLNEMWRNCARDVSELLTANDIEGLEDLVEQGLQTIAFGLRLYQWFGSHVGAEVPIEDADIEDAVMYVATNVVGGVNRKSHLDVFLGVMARAARHGYIEEDTHYTFVHEDSENEELRFSLTTVFDKVARYAREHDVAEDLLNSADDYRERISDAEGSGYVRHASIPTSGLNRCVGIHAESATAEIDGFTKGMFVDVEDDEHTNESATPLRKLEPGYADVTVRCVSSVTDTPDALSETGTLSDSSGVVDYVVWDRADPVELEEDEAYLIKNAKVGNDPDGAVQIELDGKVSEIKPISDGVGNLSYADPDENEQIDAVSDGGDREFEQAKPRMKQLLEEDEPLSIPEWLAAAQRAGLDRESAQGGIDSLKSQGEIYPDDERDDAWRVS